MKAFLSHSSKDKSIVRKIADRLGCARCEYDEYTFEYTLNSKAIRTALARSDIFVLFLSENSTGSSFVDEEIRHSLDLRAQGKLKKILIFPLDDTSYKALPEWMQSINNVIRLSSYHSIYRKIESELFELEMINSQSSMIVIPREEEEQELRKALSKPPGDAPIALHIVGHTGIGRRTLLREALKKTFPRQIQTFIQIPLGKFEGPNEFYRRLYELFVVSSIDRQISDFEKFRNSSEEEQVELLCDLFIEVGKGEEFIIVDDQGGVYTDSGNYQTYLVSLVDKLRGASRPFVGFIQTRMMPLRYREENIGSFHQHLTSMSDTQISQLTSFSLKDSKVDYSAKQLSDICLLLDGNPINVKLAMKAIGSYGLASFIADPSILIEWKRRRAEDFLSKIEFCNTEIDILSVLFDYRYVGLEIIIDILTDEIGEITTSLRRLEEYCCIERSGSLYTIPSALRDAIGRDRRFQKKDSWRKAAASKIVDVVSKYNGDDRAPVSLLETAAIASIIADKPKLLISRYILPSYYVTLALRAYQDDRQKAAIDFSNLAWDGKNNLTTDAKIEVLRIRGLASARLGDEDGLNFALKELGTFPRDKVACRHKFFLEGFSLRLRRRLDDAEKKFLAAHKLAPRNLSINRELANIYRLRREFVEGESYARAAFGVAPTNPFILDILLECLLGKSQENIAVDHSEINRLLQDLAKYGDVPGSSFYQTRVAHDLFQRNMLPDALRAATKAIERTADFLPCRYLRAEIYLAMSNAQDARKDLNSINSILERRGGFSEIDEGKAVDLEIRILVEEFDFRSAIERLKNSQFLPFKSTVRLSKKIARAIKEYPSSADNTSKKWASEFELSLRN